MHDWLRAHDIEFDELVFGKPHADVYIDDNALQFQGNWPQLETSGGWRRTPIEASGLMNIVITMAGEGRRFADAGFAAPKPLIPVLGEPMYRHSVRSLPLHRSAKLIFVILRDRHTERLRTDIEEAFAVYRPEVVELDRVTRGQAESVLGARNCVAYHHPTLVHNADSAFVSGGADGDMFGGVEGALLVFDSAERRWSYARTDEAGRVQEVREKSVISSHASTGTYYFRSTTQLFALIDRSIEQQDMEGGEFYIAPLYNRMIAAGQHISIVPVAQFMCFGTPSDLSATLANPETTLALEGLRRCPGGQSGARLQPHLRRDVRPRQRA
ncbi:glycosyltransferase family 2 protein [Bradyrhizobium sp. ORS 375]|uniref:glycosyltransferase family 2 protein n=1 Tax=Bradyrhizobium sp. (strain ORS 375) TaxID=566679 RepID=UPI0002EEF067|nr:glycosyltransferase family 2 protein [Bradyrhizobium sp. ORS 375]